MPRKIINKWDKLWRLTYINDVESTSNRRKAVFMCDCWKICEIRVYNFTSWHTKSCWCIKSLAFKKIHKRLYSVYNWIMQRCNNINSQSYKDYWGRGIKCEWETFEDFYEDMWQSYVWWLEVDRKNNDWNYCKANCRWATRKQNLRNKRNTVYFNWVPLVQICEDRGLVYKRVHWRIRHWKSIEESLF